MKTIAATRQLRDFAVTAALLVGALSTALSADMSLKLSGAAEVPAVATSATGTGTIVITLDKSVSGSVKTVGMEGTMAHIHLAPPGQNGPPIISLVKTAVNVWSVPESSTLTDDEATGTLRPRRDGLRTQRSER